MNENTLETIVLYILSGIVLTVCLWINVRESEEHLFIGPLYKRIILGVLFSIVAVLFWPIVFNIILFS